MKDLPGSLRAEHLVQNDGKRKVVFRVTLKEAPCWRRGCLARSAELSSPISGSRLLQPQLSSPCQEDTLRNPLLERMRCVSSTSLQIHGSLGRATACLCMTLAFGWKHLSSSSSWDCPTDLHGPAPGDSGCPGILGHGEGRLQSRTRGEGSRAARAGRLQGWQGQDAWPRSEKGTGRAVGQGRAGGRTASSTARSPPGRQGSLLLGAAGRRGAGAPALLPGRRFAESKSASLRV